MEYSTVHLLLCSTNSSSSTVLEENTSFQVLRVLYGENTNVRPRDPDVAVQQSKVILETPVSPTSIQALWIFG